MKVVGGVTVAAVDDTGVVGEMVRSVPAQKKHTNRLIVIDYISVLYNIIPNSEVVLVGGVTVATVDVVGVVVETVMCWSVEEGT